MRSASCAIYRNRLARNGQGLLLISGCYRYVNCYTRAAVSKDVPAETLSTVVCGGCDGTCDLQDNFCRYCGFSLVDEPALPSFQTSRLLPAIRTPSVPATVAKGAAFVAAGKIAEIVVRRVARNVLGGGRSNGASKGELVPAKPETLHTTEVVSETVLLRQTRIRR